MQRLQNNPTKSTECGHSWPLGIPGIGCGGKVTSSTRRSEVASIARRAPRTSGERRQ